MPRLGNGRDDLDFDERNQRCASPIKCAICNESLENMTEMARQYHYETHFNEPPQVQQPPLLPSYPTNVVESTSATAPKLRSSFFPIAKDAGRFWTTSHAIHAKPPSNYTPNLIPIIRKALTRSHAKGTTQRAAVCQAGLCHISRELFDATYGCGYRNFMMACTSLFEQDVMPQYFSLLEEDGGPSFRKCQEWIEKAWSEGFDEVGATQLKHKLIGTMKWIGTAELYTAFTYRGIPARLIDFPESGSRPEVVTRWVSEYFFPPNPAGNARSALSGASPIVQTEKPPLILQHQGHSRTIVGIEINRAGAPNLLLFDPGKKIPASLKKRALSSLPTPQIHTSPPKAGPSSKIILGNGFDHKRPRFADTDDEEEDSPEPEPKRGKFEASSSNSNKAQFGDSKLLDESDYLSVLKVFRVNLTNLKKKDKYQILAFTLDPPLTESERWARRIVTSEKVV